MRIHVVAALCAGALLPAVARPGDVRGQVRYEGKVPALPPTEVTKDGGVCGQLAVDESLLVRDGGLANVVVRVVVPGAEPKPARVALDQRGCRFLPHVLAAPAGSTLVLLNGDPILHGVHGWSGRATAFDVPLATKGERKTHRLERPGVIRVGCDVHGWMSAWIVVVDGPHFAVTDARGRFSIRRVPPGKWTAIAWHETLGERIGTVTVPEKGTAKLELRYP